MTRALLVALLIAIVIGVIGTYYFWQVRRRRDEAASGVRALSAMRWREFAHFVLDAMRHRGYDVITPADEADRGQQTEFLLVRDGERALLGCKHGSAYRLSKQTVSEFVAAMRFQGARSGLLVTPGTIDEEARRSAEHAHVELVDGLKLWPEISPLLPPSLNEDVRKDAAHRARRQVALSWIAAAVAGLALGLLLAGLREAAPPQDMTVLYRKPAPAAAPVAAPSTTAPIGISAPSTAVVAATPEQEDQQRAEVVRLIVTIPGVDRAVWSTKSTLLVHVDETTTQRFDEICGVLMHYANLRTARVHL
jgi:restriction system protein